MEKRSDEPTSVRVDIACGKNKKDGFTGVDIWDGADIVCNLEKFPWPFADGSVDEIFCSHYIEHTPDLISFANELYRIMKVGATAEIIAPYYSSMRAWQDPTHLRAISEATFLYFNREWRTMNNLDHYPISVDFDAECHYIFDPHWQGKEGNELQFAIRHYINVVSDIHVLLTKRKPVDDKVYDLQKQAAAYWDDDDFERALVLCRELIKIEENLDALIMIGEYELKKENFDMAIMTFLHAVELDEKSFEGHAGVVRALVASGRPEEAQRHIDKFSQHDAEAASLLEAFL
jgi:tetratricopeptide (TPR) repeat protein